MRIALPERHHLSIDPSSEWLADERDPKVDESLGLYLRSVEHGVYFNVRAHDAGPHPLTAVGLVALLGEQGWASPPFDEWVSTLGALTIAGGTFETVGMGGEVVLEVFATDGRSVANIVGPGERRVIAAITGSVRRLVETVRFE